MARIKTSEVVQGIAGMAKNHLYSCWKGVGYLMSKPVSLSNPRSLVQQSVRAYTTFLSRAWSRDLTDAQRAGWDELAQQQGSAAVNTAPNLGGGAGSLQVIPRGGKVMSGYNCFIKHNYAALEIGIPPISPPVPDAPLGIDSPPPVTDLEVLLYCRVQVEEACSFLIRWQEPFSYPVGSVVRVWCRSIDAGVHRQVVFLRPLPFSPLEIDIRHVKIAQGAIAHFEDLPGHYCFQVDVVDTHGQRSPPSNVVCDEATPTCALCIP